MTAEILTQKNVLKILNYVIFYIVWYMALLTADGGYVGWLVLGCFALLLFHYHFFAYVNEMIFVMMSVVLGLLCEIFFLNLSFYTFLNVIDDRVFFFPPFWVLSLWIAMSLQWCHSMSYFLQNRNRRFFFAVSVVFYHWLAQSLNVITWLIDPRVDFMGVALMIFTWFFILEMLVQIRKRFVY
jgi:hypothetical protein